MTAPCSLHCGKRDTSDRAAGRTEEGGGGAVEPACLHARLSIQQECGEEGVQDPEQVRFVPHTRLHDPQDAQLGVAAVDFGGAQQAQRLDTKPKTHRTTV